MLQLSEKEMKTMQNYYSLMDMLAERGTVSNGCLDYLLMSMLVHIHEVSRYLSPERMQSRLSKSSMIVDEFLCILNSKPPVRSVEHYAKLLNVSTAYLRNAVSKTTGRVPSQWIDDRTVREIQLLLTDSKRHYSLEEIADCGSAQQLVKFFKKHKGITPNTYRKKFL